MEISLGFLVVLVLVLLPGLIYRRLYFYGHFSKEFNAGHGLVSLLSISTIPGLIILLLSFIVYNNIFLSIDLAEIIDKFKDINNPDYRFSHKEVSTFNKLLFSKFSPFIAFEYIISLGLGLFFGRLVRFSKLDIYIKFLRFKNYWFYVFNGEYCGFKKISNFNLKNKKHLFTKADILIDSNNDTLLYSGIVVDYIINDNDSTVLSKIFLQNAERYKIVEGKRTSIEIPGTILVLDCSMMKNINLTYIYEDAKGILSSKWPSNVDVFLTFIYTISIPFFIFKISGIKYEAYNSYFEFNFIKKLIVYLFFIQSLALLNPFLKVKDDYKFITRKHFFAKIIVLSILLLLYFIL